MNIKRATLFGIISFLVGLSIVILITLFPRLEPVQAQAINPRLIASIDIVNPVETSTWGMVSFPVENFQAFTSPFGYRRSPRGRSRWEFHNGLDIAAPLGSYVRSSLTGTVIEVGDKGRCGTKVVIQSGEWEHIYCHMMGKVKIIDGHLYMSDPQGEIKIKEGQEIEAGTRIGRIGMTGRTTGPHLHWGLKHKNEFVDPALVLKEMSAREIARDKDENTIPENPPVNPESETEELKP